VWDGNPFHPSKQGWSWGPTIGRFAEKTNASHRGDRLRVGMGCRMRLRDQGFVVVPSYAKMFLSISLTHFAAVLHFTSRALHVYASQSLNLHISLLSDTIQLPK